MDGNISLDSSAVSSGNDSTSTAYKVGVVNARSMSSKFGDLGNLFEAADVKMVLISETWENKNMFERIEAFQHSHDVTWHSNQRVGTMGGGVAIAVSNRFATSKRLEFSPPAGDAEIVWALVCPLARPSVRIVAASFYSPPPKQGRPVLTGALQEHIFEVMELCNSKYRDAIFMIGGDINHDTLEEISSIEGFSQVVKESTRKGKLLDVLVTNACHISGRISPPLRPDDDSGAPSDHHVPISKFLLPSSEHSWITVKKRRFNQMNQDPYAKELANIRWKDMTSMSSVEEQVKFFHDNLDLLADKYFPMKSFRVKENEALWFSESLRSKLKYMKKTYRLEGNSTKFRMLKKSFKRALYDAKKGFYSKNIAALSKSNPQAWHKEIGRLTRNECRREPNRPPNVPEYAGLDDSECAERAADRIENITINYKPIEYARLRSKHRPGGMKVTLSDVAHAIKESNIPRGLHKQDPPRQVLKPLAEIYARPLAIIYNRCLEEGVYPSCWKQEVTSMIPKRKLIESAGDLRPITITMFFSKVFESIIRKVILSDISPNIHLEQYGGVKGIGPNHYICSLIHDILGVVENGEVGVLLTFDYSSAFNSLEHTSVIESAAELGVRDCILALLTDYLYGRHTIVRWAQSYSTPRLSRGGSGQGTLLSVLLFTIAVDKLLKQLDGAIEGLEANSPLRRSRPKLYVDDLALLISFDPKTFEDNNFKDDGRLRSYLNIIETFSSSTGMRLNKSKTAAVVFNCGKEEINFNTNSMQFGSGEGILVREEVKLLGVIIDNKISFDSFVKQRRASALNSLWQLRKLKDNGVDVEGLKAIYEHYVRSVLEFGVVPIFPMLNAGQVELLERVQRCATRSILGVSFDPLRPEYHERLQALQMETLSVRWSKQFTRFASKVESEKRFKRFLMLNPATHGMDIRRRNTYYVPTSRTERYRRSPINSILRCLNGEQISLPSNY